MTTQACLDRADRLARSGLMARAVAELARGLRRKASPGLWAHKALLEFQRSRPEAALKDIDRALALDPGDSALKARRAEILASLNHPRAALRDAAPDSFVRLRLLLSGRRHGMAGKLADRLMRRGGPAVAREALYYRGRLRLQEGRLSTARADLRRVMEGRKTEPTLALKARFYWTVANVADQEFSRRFPMDRVNSGGGPRLFLCGLGLFPPYTATVEVLHALGRCEVIYNNLSGAEIREFLAGFCPKIIPTRLDTRHDHARGVARMLADLKRGRRVGFVTRGHPLVFGLLGTLLVRACARLGLPCETFAAVSSIDVLLARTGQSLGQEISGVQVFDRSAVERARTMNTEHPLLVYFYDQLRTPQLRRFERSLLRFYPPGHGGLVFGPQYDGDPEGVRLGEFASRFPDFDSSRILYVPPLAGRAARECRHPHGR